ncbi:MAG: class I SAM-dependent methyltransferase [Myxococcales bacterium]
MKRWLVGTLVLAGALGAGCRTDTGAAPLQARTGETWEKPRPVPAQAWVESATRTPDVIFVPTPQAVVDAMLEVAHVRSNDVLYDLGSGDGRIPITAAQRYGTRAVGIDIDPQRVREAKSNAEQAGVGDKVEFLQQDLFETDFSDATVVTLYLLPNLNLKLRPRLLQELRPGTRIVSHAFDMGDWKPDKVLNVEGRTIYYWVVPER